MFRRLCVGGLVLAINGSFAGSFAAAQWTPVRFTNEALRAKGTETGDGCQWFRALAVDARDGNFMLWCTDVGGLFRSLDGGKTWEPANVGFSSRGSCGVAIDPRNPDRVLVIAANSVAHPFNGVYLSTDRAASWKQVLPARISGSRDRRQQVVFDPASYDPAAGYCKVAYWSRAAVDKPMWGEAEVRPALYKSTDGGATWAEVPGAEAAAGCELAVDGQENGGGGGGIYAAGPTGLRVSRDGGATWERTLEGECTGVAVSRAAAGSVWVTQADKVLRSSDGGKTWQRVSGADGLAKADSKLRSIAVAPSDPRRMVLWRESPGWQFPRFYSHDGGETWHEGKKLTGDTIVPSNARDAMFAFHPTDPDVIISVGGDYPTLSRDGGKTYRLAGNGVNNIFVGGAFNFSAVNPDVLFFGSQDYATLLTTDGGTNWTYLEPGKKGWGGYNYGGYASTPDALVVGESESWGGPKRLAVSRDRGKSWEVRDEVLKGYGSYGDPKNPQTLFASNFRSADAGKSWKPMAGVDVVLTHDPKTGEVYGLYTVSESAPGVRTVVRSADGGATWVEVCRREGEISDVAVEPGGGRVWVAAGERLRSWEKGTGAWTDHDLPPDQEGPPHVRSVAVDPVDPSVIYVAGNRNTFASDASAFRSVDGGKTWEILTRRTPLGSEKPGLDGGREAMWVRVNARTREAWFATNCYGVWRYAPPGK